MENPHPKWNARELRKRLTAAIPKETSGIHIHYNMTIYGGVVKIHVPSWLPYIRGRNMIGRQKFVNLPYTGYT